MQARTLFGVSVLCHGLREKEAEASDCHCGSQSPCWFQRLPPRVLGVRRMLPGLPAGDLKGKSLLVAGGGDPLLLTAYCVYHCLTSPLEQGNQ